MKHGFTSTRHKGGSLKSFGSMKAFNVTASNLNAKGDMYWRGKRGGEAMMSKGKSGYYGESGSHGRGKMKY